MAKSKRTSSSPSGLAIVRNGNKFEFSWKIPHSKYEDGQRLQWHIKVNGKWSAWTNISINSLTTKKTVTVSASSYFPTTADTLEQVAFRVRGKRADTDNYEYEFSDWSRKAMNIQKPNQPEITATLSNNSSNVTTFSWTVSTDDKSARWFAGTKYETILVKNCTETDGSKLKWKTSTLGWATGTSSSSSGSQTKTEDSALLAKASYTRWFRVCSRGPQGSTKWKYAKHVYAKPNQATIKKVKIKTTSSTGYNANVTWESPADAAHPIDKTTVQYHLVTPIANLAHPTSNTGWQNGPIITDTKGNDAANFPIPSLLTTDQCLYVRVNNMHDKDTNTTYGDAYLAKIGKLADPTNISVSLNSTTYTATVTATNNSNVPDSFLAIVYRRKKKERICGIIAHGSSSVSCQLNNWSDDPNMSFGAYAVVGSYSKKNRADNTDAYAVTARMTSENTIWTAGDVPKAPSSVTVSMVDGTTDTVRVTWGWAWSSADSAVLAWSDHEDAWESTDEPEMYTIENTDATAWNISGLEPGKTWYVAVRLVSDDVYGPWSTIKSIDLSSPPVKPSLLLSSATITPQSKFTAYWTYVSTDGTSQMYAKLVNTTIDDNGNITRGDQLAYAESAQSVMMECPSTWTAGNQYYLSLKVTSASGHESDWSDPVSIMVADPISCTITQNSFSTVTITSTEGGSSVSRTVTALTAMPLTVTATGAGAGGTTTAIIERTEDFHVDRPDETQFNGFEGETIALVSQAGESQITIKNNMLVGVLDDGAAYRLIMMSEDSYGQVASSTIDFEVHWSHQAVEPTATAVMDGTIAKISATQPSGYASGDTIDIYRLSVDAPMLVVSGGAFGTTYVDPYPAIGTNGGYRVVYRTGNGDYITSDGIMAWRDLATNFNVDYSIIDFGNDQVTLPFNLTLGNSWKKDFQETQYLGGAVQGDWNPSVSRTLSMGTALVAVKYENAITQMRKLAVYPGLCHVRTQDGSSFDADIEVTESRSYDKGRIVEFSLGITRVDPEGYDGMTLAEWEAIT